MLVTFIKSTLFSLVLISSAMVFFSFSALTGFSSFSSENTRILMFLLALLLEG